MFHSATARGTTSARLNRHQTKTPTKAIMRTNSTALNAISNVLSRELSEMLGSNASKYRHITRTESHTIPTDNLLHPPPYLGTRMGRVLVLYGAHTRTHTLSHTRTHTYTLIYSYTHTHTHTHAHTHAHVHTHAHTYTHTQIRRQVARD
jgi:hypothetical protein